MSSPFRIPKKKVPSDCASLHMPPSGLQSPGPQRPACNLQSGQGDKMHAGKPGGSSQGAQKVQSITDVVKVLLGMRNPIRGGGAATNHRATGGGAGQSQLSKKAESSGLTNGRWRPKRASDRLLEPKEASNPSTPPQKKKCGDPSGAPSERSISVLSIDSLAQMTAKHAGSQSPAKDNQRKYESVGGSCPESPQKPQNDSSEEDSMSPGLCRSAASTCRLTGVRRPSLQHHDGDLLPEDVRERQRAQWLAYIDRKNRSHTEKDKRRSSEPIVLSSEDEAPKTSPTNRVTTHTAGLQKKVSTPASPTAAPCFLQLDFRSLHAGLTNASANGSMKITESSINIPLKGNEDHEEAEVTVVASQLRGYGVWDGGVAKDGSLLAGWAGPAPSLLVLWVTDAQAVMLQRELVDVRSTAAMFPPCNLLLLVLKEQLEGLQVALLASILDMKQYQQGRTSSGGDPSSPLSVADGHLLLHRCPPPLDQHLLRLLGHSKSSPSSSSQKSRTPLQQLPTRLIQYPKPPCKGRITVTQEDLVCLNHGEFINDVIIDFYLKYLLLEGVGGDVAERSHVFSSFFFKHLSRRRGAGEDDASFVLDRHVRHQRVKTWTRHVDIFTKDFLFIPVNQDAHWFLVVVIYPGLEELTHEDFKRPAGKNNCSLTSQQAPECTRQGWTRNTVLKRPCILVMDSLKLSHHDTVCSLIRDYLQVEWGVRRSTPRSFTEATVKNCSCRVPQQDNGSDCGVYLLQYAHSFLQNPVVHFDLPVQLEGWFPRQQARQKREEIRRLILRLKDAAT